MINHYIYSPRGSPTHHTAQEGRTLAADSIIFNFFPINLSSVVQIADGKYENTNIF